MFAVGFLCRVLTTQDFSCTISFSRSHSICLNKCSEGTDGEGYDRNRALTHNCCQKHLASSVCVFVYVCLCVNISRHTRQPYVCSVLETSGFAFTLAYIFSKCQTQDDARTKHLWLLLSFVPLFGPKDKHFSRWSRRATQHIVNRRFIHPQLLSQDTAQVHMNWT
jgi:hypothetical protein